MNYLAHGLHFVDQPYRLAGTAVPDWLSAADRRIRVRERHATALLDDASAEVVALANGVVRHHQDDDWFHRTRAFAEVTAELGRRFREALGSTDGFRCGFLGHIVTELLIDAELDASNPGLLDAYYDCLSHVDSEFVQGVVNAAAPRSTERLAPMIDAFRRHEFLRDYRDPERLLHRLNQVLRRITLRPLPDGVLPVLVEGRTFVAERLDELLPPERFTA